ncbi:hypothetical protein GCM10010112_90830 [Actinoplanes lobatus]|uniref:Uncharacterized protein n=1 Tax=Actinoplanes lobatus TaxID=113568 RepID=A0A7W7HLF7_9ACTN|nr:hypothetical protein [Actinoplanes lobatus]MBB4752590.1 hypothetical protein [Actinoplanes lobatus]GGN98050.1 hypothetical protein GCM10010112_90830 [Actinoplanes lobatus]GIE45868.1 hypothetical protein Alo02nite_87660 [Actinoplanes lobatus]
MPDASRCGDQSGHRWRAHAEFVDPASASTTVDIDPTLLLRRTENRVYSDTPTTWYAPAAATFPHGIDETWPIHDEHSPPADALINCTDPDGKRWLVLEGHYQWSQPQYPEDAAADHPHHVTWAQIRSYLINANSIDTWANWAKDQDWNGRWMPESGSPPASYSPTTPTTRAGSTSKPTTAPSTRGHRYPAPC